MVGPLFLLEWKNASRRSGHFRFRTMYTALVLAEFLFVLFAWWLRRVDPLTRHTMPWQRTAEVVADYLPLFAIQNLRCSCW